MLRTWSLGGLHGARDEEGRAVPAHFKLPALDLSGSKRHRSSKRSRLPHEPLVQDTVVLQPQTPGFHGLLAMRRSRSTCALRAPEAGAAPEWAVPPLPAPAAPPLRRSGRRAVTLDPQLLLAGPQPKAAAAPEAKAATRRGSGDKASPEAPPMATTLSEESTCWGSEVSPSETPRSTWRTGGSAELPLLEADFSDAEESPPRAGSAGSAGGEEDPRSAASAAAPPPEAISGPWRRGAALGSGSYGAVHRAQELSTGRLFAVKRALAADAGSRALAQLRAELDICRSVSHPNIVSYLGHQMEDGALHIFMEFMTGGSIAAVLKDFGALSPEVLRRATRGALSGLDYLHTLNPPIVHRDIKGANLLVDVKFNVKLADFGCSHCSASTVSFETVGSIPWMAPEVAQQQDGHGRKADIWSMGCTVLEMATAETPWGRGAFDNVMFALHRIAMTDALPSVPESLPEPCRDFIYTCLRRNPAARPTAAELLSHSLLSA